MESPLGLGFRLLAQNPFVAVLAIDLKFNDMQNNYNFKTNKQTTQTCRIGHYLKPHRRRCTCANICTCIYTCKYTYIYTGMSLYFYTEYLHTDKTTHMDLKTLLEYM